MITKGFFRMSALAMGLSLVLTGCDGDDGAPGPAGQTGATGPQGEQGPAGQDGQNAGFGVSMNLIGRAQLLPDGTPSDQDGAAEIVQYHAASQTIYVINSAADVPTVEMIDASGLTSAALALPYDGTNLTATGFTLETEALGIVLGGPNSIAVYGDWMAVAVEADAHADNGVVLFYNGLDAGTPTFNKAVEVGNLPDMLTFTPDGSKVLVANEGEPSDDYSVDPVGGVSVIDIVDGTPADTATTLGFEAYNGRQAALEAQGMHFPNPTGRTINGNAINITVAQDLEPEYITATNDTAFVALQENNGLAIVDLTDNSMSVVGLGLKDWSGLNFDGTEDGTVSFDQYQDLYGIYQPDTIATYQWNGANFIVTANEGDAREYFFDAPDEATCLNTLGGQDYDEDDGCLAFTEETQARRLSYAPGSNLESIAGGDPRDSNFEQNKLGRLRVTNALGDGDNDGVHETIVAYGARSFSIFDSNGVVAFDSGDDFARITASVHGNAFNNDNDVNEGDSRSENKASEPEALALGQVGERTYAFIGLERMGGIMVYDITNPFDTRFVDYVINRDLTEGLAVDDDMDIPGDLAPEGMAFVEAVNSPTGNAILVIGNEVSGTVSVWEMTAN